MKKLMIMAAIAVMAIASQAYDVKWGARNIYIPVAADAAISESGIVAASGNKFAAGALAVQLYWVGTEGNNYIGEFNTTGVGTISAQTLGSGTSSQIYTAMVADHGDTWNPQYYFTATYETEKGVYTYAGTATASSPIKNLGSSNQTLTAKFDEAGTWTYTANVVPEPTSGLLLLLGVAGLALRRRRA